MRFVHGSEQLFDKFSFFDYLKDPMNRINNPAINNGIDQYGPGINCLCIDDVDKQKRAIEYAERYAGKDGYLYFISMDVCESEMLNKLPPHEINPELWEKAIINMIEEVRGSAGKDRYSELVGELYQKMEDGENVSLAEIEDVMSDYPFDFSYCDPEEVDLMSWEDEMHNVYSLEEPASYILDEGTPQTIATRAIDVTDNAWETLMYIWNVVAIQETGLGIHTKNQMFYNATRKSFKDYTPPGVYIEDEDFHVLFDIDSVTIDRVLEVSGPELNSELSA